MKNLKFIPFLLASIQLFSQQTKTGEIKANDGLGFSISGGSHVGFWSLLGQHQIPYNIQIDKSINENFVIGLGYTNDDYEKNPLSWAGGYENTIRQNINFRFYNFLPQKRQYFRSFIGGSAGVSLWESNRLNSKPQTFPSAQFIYGFRIKIFENFFNQTEFAIGPPCALKTSFGFNF